MNAFIVFAALIFVIFYLIIVISKRKFGYWKNKNVPHLKPLPILGNYGSFISLRQYPGLMIQKLCKKFEGHPYFGAFYGTEPVLIVQSPEFIKHVVTKDFYYFHGREITKYAKNETVTNNLFFSGGDRWKVLRQTLTPLFTSAKMKNMFSLIEKCSHKLEDMLDYEIGISNVLGMRDISARYTMDCICSCAFGVEANTMEPDQNNPFRFMAREIFLNTNIRGLKIICRSIWPALFYGLGLKVFPDTIETFFSQMLKGVFESRNYKPTSRNDFVDYVLSLKNDDYWVGDSITNMKNNDEKRAQIKVDDTLLVSQCIMFFGAGFETSSASISFTLFELAKNQEVQRRAAEEVDEFLKRHNNKLVYECVHELQYLNACIYESLRKYPLFGNITREVMDDTVLPTGLHIDKGVRVHIPVYHIHNNPDNFPDPCSYKPDRFMPENKDDVKPYTFFPYGEGPRICIGKRFSKMQVMSGLLTILKKFKLELADDMPDTVELDARTWFTQPKDTEIKLKLTKRDGWEERCFLRD